MICACSLTDLSWSQPANNRQGDLISYLNDRKGCAVIVGKVESVSEYAAACIAMLTDQ